MDKKIIEQYVHDKARVKLLRQSVEKLENRLVSMNKQGYYVTDTVTRGRKGKKPLGTVIVAGFPHPEYERLCRILDRRKERLVQEELGLLESAGKVEEYIASIDDKEIRNLFTLYYVEDLNWVQVARRMNEIYGRKWDNVYTDSSCRNKHNRFLEKF